jgi:hypothetical protein
MKILFDQGTPVPLRRFLDGHEVHTVFEKGWDRLTNGDVLAAAILNGYEIFCEEFAIFESREGATTLVRPMTRSTRVESWPVSQSTCKMSTASGTTRPPRRVGNVSWRFRNRAPARHTVLPPA